MKNKKNEKRKYEDDGHTIYSMDVDAKWSKSSSENKKIYVSKEEKRTLIKAAFIAYFPKLLLVLAAFTLTFILMYFWLK